MPAHVFIATSLDGFIARPDGALDWLPVPEPGGEDYGYQPFIESVEAVVMGRGTFDAVQAMATDWQYGKPIVVLTSRPMPDTSRLKDQITPMHGSPHEIVAACAARGWHSLYVDGGVTIQRFLAAGLVERLIVTRIPILIGQGLPLFGVSPQDIALTHVHTQAFPSGMVQSEYRVQAPKSTP
jgi:dihydrofolate reductase